MADPLLTSLCAICHIEPPRYKCPRCTIRTCSLACTKRHKAWSSCNGIRDATAYVPPSKLKTAAGVDHDFNFLSGIERAVQRSEKEIVEERQLLRPEDLRPIEVRSVQWKIGRDGRKKRVLVTEVLKGDSGSARQEALMSMPFKKRLSRFGILLRRAPVGMVRQRENGTNFSKASGRINWQVEWLLVPSQTETETMEQQKEGDEAKKQMKRILAKALDDIPLYKAFATGQRSFHDEQARKEQQRQQRDDNNDDDGDDEAQDGINANTSRPKKRRKHQHKPGQSLATAQDTETGAWHPGRFCMQTSPRGAWTPHTGPAPYTGTTEEEEAQKSKYAFYLAGTTSAATSAAGKTVVHAVDAAVPLGEALRDMTVLEFPTIYVVEAGAALPDSLLEEPKPVRLVQKRKRDTQMPGKRGGGKGGKRARRNLEEGELPTDGEDSDVADEDVDRFAAAVEQIIAEESLGEEDDDSTTSSSGSDSESDEDVKASLAAKLALLKKQQA
ncbi:hit zinc finger [Colletotrichum incanum]|uniref:Box C/D snoRNA protein 1 n=1 Tax=Colletotrichum incanum TaxID=1573173 RepID=A0A162PX96_COLIC|nr:hit zinc finger [Colletotrichum incanum]OHW91944.1 HIT zinc finger [Colletotrichum incanum]